jgi:hypothetical protein
MSTVGAKEKLGVWQTDVTMYPKKMNFDIVFQNIYPPSTREVRVLSVSRWSETLPNEYNDTI